MNKNKHILTTKQLDKVRGGDDITAFCLNAQYPAQCEQTVRASESKSAPKHL